MSAAVVRDAWNTNDPMLVALVVATVLHAFLILGLGVELPKQQKIRKSLEIALVRNPSTAAPPKAEFLASDNQFGGGKNHKKAVPKVEPKPQPAAGSGTDDGAEPVRETVKEVRARPVLTQSRAEKKVVADTGHEVKAEVEQPHVTQESLRQQIADFTAEYNHALAEQAKQQPRMVYLNSVNAHRYKAAAYEQNWQAKVERIGNINYPEAARRQNLSGSLLLAVGIRPDGSVESVKVRHSSGSQVLDDAAVRIVRLASPFAPLPRELLEEADGIVITRTWKFLSDNRVETSR